jgi:hypothetical protein
MMQHLSSREISRWIIGERTAEREEHVGECAQCAAEIARTEAALGLFRGTVRNWSGEQGLAPVREFWSAPHPIRFRRWAMAAAALATAAAIPIYFELRHRRQVELAAADAALMQQVDSAVSRPIAGPMQPLVKLMAWHDNTNNGEIR